MSKKYRFIDHTADIAIEVNGGDITSLFLNCGNALFDLLYDVDDVSATETHTVNATGETPEELLINFLRELFFSIEVYGNVLNDITITKLTESAISAEVTGEKYDSDRHRLRNDIKAVTYHNVNIAKSECGLKVAIVFDT